MFLHSAWIFHPEARVAPINSTEPPSLQSAQLCSPPHRGWLAHAGGLPLQLSLPRQLSFTELSAVWLAACHRLHTPPSSLCLLSASGWTYHKTRGEQTWRLSHSATPKGYQRRMILWHLLRLDACRQSWPVKKVRGNGVNAMVLLPTRPC